MRFGIFRERTILESLGKDPKEAIDLRTVQFEISQIILHSSLPPVRVDQNRLQIY